MDGNYFCFARCVFFLVLFCYLSFDIFLSRWNSHVRSGAQFVTNVAGVYLTSPRDSIRLSSSLTKTKTKTKTKLDKKRQLRRGGGVVTQQGFIRGLLHPEIQPLTLLYTIFDTEKVPLSFTFYLTICSCVITLEVWRVRKRRIRVHLEKL